MSDRSDEVTESRDTDDLLEETEDLLSESGVGDGAGAGTESDSAARRDDPVADEETDDSWWSSNDAPAERSAGTESAPETTSGADGTSSSLSRLSRLTAWLSVDNYFSPKAFLAFLLLAGAGLFAGATVVPIGGRIVGAFTVAFALGLLTSKRRYLEMAAAGASVGAISALAGNAMLAFAGSLQTVAAVGVAMGLGACLGGYYFGRDLKNGLSQDVE